MNRGARSENFPAPIAKVTSSSPLWDWAAVTKWMYKKKKIGFEEAVAAETVKEANEAIREGKVAIGDHLRRHARAYSDDLKKAA